MGAHRKALRKRARHIGLAIDHEGPPRGSGYDRLAFAQGRAILVAVPSKVPPVEAPPAEREREDPAGADLSDIRGRLAKISAELARRREATATSNERLERAQRLFTSAQSQVEDAEEVRTRTGEVPGRKRPK